MASELAREIIDQSRPRDRPSNACITFENGHRHLKITSPVVNGERLLRVKINNDSFQYNPTSNLDWAATLVEWMLDGARPTYVTTKTLTTDGQESSTVCSWTLIADNWPESEKETVFQRLRRILKILMEA